MLSTMALFSSSRRHGNTGRLIDRIARELDIEVVDLTTLRMSSYDYDHLNRNDDFEPLMKHVLTHEQIIFATPIYWYAVSPAMKIFLDRFSDLLEVPELLPEGRRLRGKNAYIRLHFDLRRSFKGIHGRVSGNVPLCGHAVWWDRTRQLQ